MEPSASSAEPYRSIALFFAGATALALWLMTASSQAIWRLLPLAALIQFPWRLLSLTSLSLAVLAGPAIAEYATRNTQHEAQSKKQEARSKRQETRGKKQEARGKKQEARSDLHPASCILHPASCILHPASCILHPASCVLALLIVLGSFSYTQPRYTEVTPRHESPLAVIDFELEYPDMRGMTAWASRLPQPEDAPLVEQYLAGEPLTKAHIVQGEGDVQTLRHSGASEELRVISPGGVRVQVYTYWFPGWQVRVDGEAVESWPEGPNGLITFDVPAGEHHVRVRMTENTPSRRIGGLLSGLSLAALLVLLSVGKQNQRIRAYASMIRLSRELEEAGITATELQESSRKELEERP